MEFKNENTFLQDFSGICSDKRQRATNGEGGAWMTFQFRGFFFFFFAPMTQNEREWKQQLIYREVSQKTAGILEDVIYGSQDGLVSPPSLCAGKRRWWELLTTTWLTSPWTTQGREKLTRAGLTTIVDTGRQHSSDATPQTYNLPSLSLVCVKKKNPKTNIRPKRSFR